MEEAKIIGRKPEGGNRSGSDCEAGIQLFRWDLRQAEGGGRVDTPEDQVYGVWIAIPLITLRSRKEIGEKVFSALQVESTLKNYSTMFARLLCFVIRSIQENHVWLERCPLDDEQRWAANELWDVIEREAADTIVMTAIHKLGLKLFCKERRNIQDGGFACPVYRFLVVVSLTNGGSFVSVLDITDIIAKLQWTCRAKIFEELLRRIDQESEAEVWAD